MSPAEGVAVNEVGAQGKAFPSLIKCPLQFVYQIVRIFDSDAQPKERVCDSLLISLFFGDIDMGLGCRIGNQRVDSAQTFCKVDDFYAF